MIKATRDDFDELYGIITECHEWLQSRGIRQWDSPYPKERFRSEIESGEVYRFEKDGRVIGTVTLHECRPNYYPKAFREDKLKALYLCRLAVRRNYKNQFIGSAILSEVAEQTKADGVQVLRLDVVKSNPFLKQYYSKYGFQTIGEHELCGKAAWLMEKRIEVLKLSPG